MSDLNQVDSNQPTLPMGISNSVFLQKKIGVCKIFPLIIKTFKRGGYTKNSVSLFSLRAAVLADTLSHFGRNERTPRKATQTRK